jgi:ornithine carbamoyltransferase
VNHFLDLNQFSARTLRGILEHAQQLKSLPHQPLLPGKTLAMIFEKPSTRTRVSFSVGMFQLGGQALSFNPDDLQLGRGETIEDTARALSRYVDIIMIRAKSHETLAALAQHATVPVINGLTDKSHPCQIMADILTVEERNGHIKGKKVAWLGDANNVCTSWIHAACLFGFTLYVAAPEQFSPEQPLRATAGKALVATASPDEALKDADVVVTDTWFSMGVPDSDERRALLKPYQVTLDSLKKAKKNAIFLHCLPAIRGEEMTADVFSSPQSAVWDEAENRLHVQKAILCWCLGASARL